MKKTFSELVRERSRLIKVPVIVGSLIIAAGVLATYVFSDYLSQRAADDFQIQTNEQTKIFANTIESRAAEFEQILLMLAAYSRSETELTKDNWTAFIEQSNVLSRHPFTSGIGYVDIIPSDQIGQYVESRQAEVPGLTIQPAGQRELYTAIRHISPVNPATTKVIGYDMFAEPVRKSAMEKARDSGTVAMTSPVQLVQDQGKENTYGVIAYCPVYKNGMPTSTPAQRKQAIAGYTFFSFRPSDFITNISTANPSQLNSASYTVTDSSTGVSVTSKVFSPTKSEIKYDAVQRAGIIDREWVIGLTAYQPTFQRWTAPGITFLLGIVTSFAVGGFVMYLMTRRLIRLDIIHETELQRTKDELLALTSHQLRTPASGVKQYVGMLLQGFVGELTPQQEIIAKKAFAANERQLETINQLLHVAKADADQLVLQKEHLDLTGLTTQIVDSMKDSIEEHTTEVILKAPKKEIMIFADERYLRMVIENLISNALKYSESGRKIKITLVSRQESAILSVRDYGVGINEEDIPKLFKKFSRIPNPLSKTVGGSGLGLFLSEQIMLAHKGDIECDSKPGKGSIFTLTLPLDDSVEDNN